MTASSQWPVSRLRRAAATVPFRKAFDDPRVATDRPTTKAVVESILQVVDRPNRDHADAERVVAAPAARGLVLSARIDRDRGAPHGAAPPTPPGVRVAYHGGSIGLCWGRNVESGETDRVEVVVA